MAKITDESADAHFTLTPAELTLAQLRGVMAVPARVTLAASSWPQVEAAARVVERAAQGEAAVYGVNTGFGKLATTRISADQIEELQRRLVLSHMCGVGPALPGLVVRLVLALKAASLARGHSGVRRETIELLVTLLDHDALPVIPAKGSVGASGDLAPLAHLAGCLLGRGEIRHDGRAQPAADVLGAIGAVPLTLAAKEGLALLNGTQVSTSLALAGLVRRRRGLRCRADRRRDERRCGAGQRRAVRSAAQPGARPAGPDPGRRAARGPARRQRDPRLASGRVRARAGSLQPALPAAGHGGLSRAA